MSKPTKKQIKAFADEWGQSDIEIATNLELDENDGGFSELLINLGYLWIDEHEVWVSKNCSTYTTSDDNMIDYLTANS